ncbi:MAG: ROK family transcriptional regulator [Alphaproteobacteria bacterium]|nr:ROK family transcriptional regulator [Alphaproteobacteria bacterium]
MREGQCKLFETSRKNRRREIHVRIDQIIGKEALKEARGTNQMGVRLYNERLVLSLIRRHGMLPKAELARLTGLSAQTTSVIVRQLEKDGLVMKGEPQRGKVGQPLVPFALNPDGAFSVGLKVGRRSGDLMLIDLSGARRGMVHQPYHFPTPAEFLDFAREGMAKLLTDFTPAMRKRISGLGIAAPFELWNWEAEAGAPHEVLEKWRGFDLMGEVAKLFDFPVFPCNDATAACAAELLFGNGQRAADFAYFYVGYFIGGGLVLNGSLVQGRSGNAAAFGSIPVPKAEGGAQQLIQCASFYSLELALNRSGQNASIMWQAEEDWSAIGKALDEWLPGAAAGLSDAMLAVAAVTECSEVIIDGAMPPAVRARLVSAVQQALLKATRSGITPFHVREGGIGRDARALGAAALPLFANFVIDRDVLFKEAL